MALQFQSGDSGVREVASVTIAATTGTAGNFGVVLFRPLFAICVSDSSAVAPIASLINGASCGGAPTIIDDACLFLAHVGTSTTAGHTVVVGELAKTLPAVTSSASGAGTVTGSTSATLGAVTSAASGTSTVIGALGVTLAAVTSAASGSPVVTGTLGVTLSAVTLAATGGTPTTA